MEITASRTDALLDDNDRSLVLATSLLGIDKSEFKKWLLKKQIVTRTEKIVSNLSAPQSNVVKDSVAKFIYASLFDWLVSVTNSSLTNEGVESSVRSFIGVLVSIPQLFVCFSTANEGLTGYLRIRTFQEEQLRAVLY